ncbi:MAG: gamma-glutamylcyclotransferase family protein [Pseudomonadota bacterium]
MSAAAGSVDTTEFNRFASADAASRPVFVYGTLKRGYPNYRAYLASATYLGDARTLDPYPLVIGGRYRTPFLFDEPGRGARVDGELFEVTSRQRARLDLLERVGRPRGYHIAIIPVEAADGSIVDAQCYLMDRANVAIIHEELGRTYPIDNGYVPIWKRIWARTRLKRG